MLKPVFFLLLATPALWAAYAIWLELQQPGSGLGADPGEALVLHFGEWAIRFVLLSMLLSTLQRRTPFTAAVRVRRMTGVWAFAYASLHLISYVVFLIGFSWTELVADLTERTYITVGFGAWLILSALAITSTNGWQRRLRLNWKRLHRWVYLAVGLALLHLLWLTKDGYGEFAVYLAVFVLLIGERLFDRLRRGARGSSTA